MAALSTTPATPAPQVAPAAVRSSPSLPTVSVVLPVYQERDGIADVVNTTVKVLSEAGVSFEIVAIDDGSTDGTGEVLNDLGRRYPDRLRVIRHPYNKGNGAAVRTGIRAARGETIACLDADGQHDPSDLVRLLPYTADYDLVVGARVRGYRGSWHRVLANRFYNALASWLTRFPIEDLTSGFRLFRASVVKQFVHLFPPRFSYPATSTLAFIKGGYSVKYVPITVRERQSGRSKIRLVADGWRFVLLIVKIVVIFEPLRVFLPSAAVLFLLGVASSVQSTWFLGRPHIPNSGVLLFLASMLVVLLGLLAEGISALQISMHETRRDRQPPEESR